MVVSLLLMMMSVLMFLMIIKSLWVRNFGEMEMKNGRNGRGAWELHAMESACPFADHGQLRATRHYRMSHSDAHRQSREWDEFPFTVKDGRFVSVLPYVYQDIKPW